MNQLLSVWVRYPFQMSMLTQTTSRSILNLTDRLVPSIWRCKSKSIPSLPFLSIFSPLFFSSSPTLLFRVSILSSLSSLLPLFRLSLPSSLFPLPFSSLLLKYVLSSAQRRNRCFHQLFSLGFSKENISKTKRRWTSNCQNQRNQCEYFLFLFFLFLFFPFVFHFHFVFRFLVLFPLLFILSPRLSLILYFSSQQIAVSIQALPSPSSGVTLRVGDSKVTIKNLQLKTSGTKAR
jgi:hypothetical protein